MKFFLAVATLTSVLLMVDAKPQLDNANGNAWGPQNDQGNKNGNAYAYGKGNGLGGGQTSTTTTTTTPPIVCDGTSGAISATKNYCFSYIVARNISDAIAYCQANGFINLLTLESQAEVDQFLAAGIPSTCRLNGIVVPSRTNFWFRYDDQTVALPSYTMSFGSTSNDCLGSYMGTLGRIDCETSYLFACEY